MLSEDIIFFKFAPSPITQSDKMHFFNTTLSPIDTFGPITESIILISLPRYTGGTILESIIFPD